jgi:glycosyltransferase involved in cell wall biosynthesis
MKDHVGFIAATAQVLRRCPYVRFLLAGRGVSNEQPELTKMIQEYQLQDHVFLLGERHDTPRLMLALDVACSASAWGEGFSNAIGEAMACGVPCVVTDVGDSSFIVGATGISTPPANPAGLAQGIIRLIEAGPERRQQLGLAARRRIENDFSISSVARRYQELYHHQMIFR